jgi:hypothetical protein
MKEQRRRFGDMHARMMCGEGVGLTSDAKNAFLQAHFEIC